MVQFKNKKRVYIIAGGVLVLLLLIVIVAIVNGLSSDKKDPYKQVETTNTQEQSDTTPAKPDTSSTPDTTKDDTKDTATTIDPTTVSTVAIEPMQLTVSYVKGVPGFEFYVMRTAAGTQYVEFNSSELVGTKCTNDKGVFASIVENPSDNEASTLSKTTTVGGTKYGLSLADATCTSDATLLKQYQTSFSDAFSLLKKAE